MADIKNNAVGWFEVPVTDMERAIKFYETVFELKLERHTMGELDMAWWPGTESAPGAGGSLVFHPAWYTPSLTGVLVYFTAPSGDLNNELSRVQKAGGEILIPRRQISEEYGYMALIVDTEGNRIALHSH